MSVNPFLPVRLRAVVQGDPSLTSRRGVPVFFDLVRLGTAAILVYELWLHDLKSTTLTAKYIQGDGDQDRLGGPYL